MHQSLRCCFESYGIMGKTFGERDAIATRQILVKLGFTSVSELHPRFPLAPQSFRLTSRTARVA